MSTQVLFTPPVFPDVRALVDEEVRKLFESPDPDVPVTYFPHDMLLAQLIINLRSLAAEIEALRLDLAENGPRIGWK